MSFEIGALLRLPVHFIGVEVSTATGDDFAIAETACGLTAYTPPDGGIQGYDVLHDLALTTEWSRVTCDACKKKSP